MNTNVLKTYTHAPLDVSSEHTFGGVSGWGGVSNFPSFSVVTRDFLPPEKNIDSLQDCVRWLEQWEALQSDWYIFDGSTLTFYISGFHLIERCKRIVKNYIEVETLDFEAINFVVGLPTV